MAQSFQEGGSRPEMTVELHNGTDEQISIVIVHKDRPEYLNMLLQSICICTIANNYEIIVVDNGSGKESQDFLDQLESDGVVKVVRNSKNEYWSAAANKGAKAIDPNSKYLVFMHADVVVLNPAWLDLLVNAAESQKSGMIGVDSSKYRVGDREQEYLSDHCVLLTRDCWNDSGPWNEELPMMGASFILTDSAARKGYAPRYLDKSNSLVHHYKIFSLNLNEHEVLWSKAKVTIGKLLRNSTEVKF